MGRMPSRDPLNVYLEHHAALQGHAVLIPLSGGCPTVPDRLHTRYAPVRRSPARHRCLPLPLDLHVLGLSLAFILSQDQTLRCMTYVLTFFLLTAPGAAESLRTPGALRCVSPSISMSLRSILSALGLPERLRVQR